MVAPRRRGIGSSSAEMRMQVPSLRGIGSSSAEMVMQVPNLRIRSVCDGIRRAETAARQAAQIASSTAAAFTAEADALASAVQVLEATLNGPLLF